MRFAPILLVGLLAATASTVQAENWTQFRGSASGVISQDAGLASEWGPEQNIAWKAKLPGVAWSQPIVWGDRIYVTTAVTDDQPRPDGGGGGGYGGPGGRGPGGGGGPGRDRGDRPRGDEPRDDGPREGAAGAAQPPGDRPESDQPPGDRPDGDGPPRGRRGRGPGGGGPGGGGRGFGGGGGGAPDAVYRWLLLCLDAKTGEVIWEKLAHEGKPTIPIHRTNTYASETPVTDGEHIYVYFGMTGLYCFDMQGNLVWEKSLGSYPMMLGWGAGSSPVLEGDRLIVQCDNEKESFLVVFDKKTGGELWRVPRDEKTSWCTPFIWKNKNRTELVTGGSKMIRAYNPADGKVLWELGGLRGRCAATPVGDAELLYMGVGGGMGGAGPLFAVRAGAEGDITPKDGETTSDGVAWIVERAGPPMASPLLYEGCLYVLDQRGGIVGCYDAATGKEHYKKRIENARGFTSSPWACDGRVFLLDETGQTFVLKPGPEFEVLGTNKLDDMFWSSVAVAGDHLLLRGLDHLYCIGNK